MAKIRVPQHGKPQGFHTLESDATKGAMVGRDLWWPDGSLVTYEQLTAGTGGGATGDEFPVTYWRLLMEVPVNVTALAQTSTTGLYAITGDGASATRQIVGTAQQVSVSNGDGLSGDPTIGLSDLPDTSGGTLQRFERDAKGRVSGTSEATTDDLPEGGDNLYFTDGRADERVSAGIDGHVAEENPHAQYALLSGFTNSETVTWNIDPLTGEITAVAASGGSVDSVNDQTGVVVLDTDDIAEGASNAYYTNSRVDTRVQAANYTIGGAWSFSQNITVAGTTVGRGPVGTASNASNLAFGTSAMAARVTSTNSLAVGTNSLFKLENGANNIAIGTGSLASIVNSQSNTAIGSNALTALTSGTGNLAIGDAAGRDLAGSSGCVYIGANAGLSASGNAQVAVGNNAAMYFRGGQTTAIGQSALTCSPTEPGAGQFSTAVGWNAGVVARGPQNTLIGARAGRTPIAANATTTGAACTFIGADSGQGSPVQLIYATAIGTDSLVTTNNTVVLGRVTDNTVIGAMGDDGSGSKLQVTGAIKATIEYRVGANKVVGARDTGWAAMTGAGSKAAIAATPAGIASAAYAQTELQSALNRIAALEARLRAYDAALIAHGLIGV